MRIVRRPEFLDMPAGTVYVQIGQQWIVGSFEVKGVNVGDNDWYYQSWDWVEPPGGMDAVECLDEMAADPAKSYPVQSSEGRDGSYGSDEGLFLIYEPSDILHMIGRLQSCLPDVWPEGAS